MILEVAKILLSNETFFFNFSYKLYREGLEHFAQTIPYKIPLILNISYVNYGDNHMEMFKTFQPKIERLKIKNLVNNIENMYSTVVSNLLFYFNFYYLFNLFTYYYILSIFNFSSVFYF